MKVPCKPAALRNGGQGNKKSQFVCSLRCHCTTRGLIKWDFFWLELFHSWGTPESPLPSPLTHPLLRMLYCMIRSELTLQLFPNRGANLVCHPLSASYSHKAYKNFICLSSLGFVAKWVWRSHLGRDWEMPAWCRTPHHLSLNSWVEKNTLDNLNNFHIYWAVGLLGWDHFFISYEKPVNTFLPSPADAEIS